MKKIILAVDSYKGCLSSQEIEETMADELSKNGNTVISLPMSDGGEGMLEAFCSALNGRFIECKVHDPLMRIVTARYGITPHGTAIIETAQACGLTLMKPYERNPMTATTFGVGELICDAFRNGCRDFIIGLGGSGTSDCGIGMLNAMLIDMFNSGDYKNSTVSNKIKEKVTGELNRKDFEEFAKRYHNCRFTIASDVRNVLYGENGAAYIFSPQKGATVDMVRELDRNARLFAQFSANLTGKDESGSPGAGAAGGLGYALMQYLNARFVPGADLLLDMTDFNNIANDADLIITGEGSADQQTLMGKLPERVLRRAQQKDVPVWLVAGKVSNKDALLSAGFFRVESITPEEMELAEAVKPDNARANLVKFIRKFFA